MNPFRKKGLGRGLSSLIGDVPKIATINKLSISDITRNKHQPRKSVDKDSLEELTNSIKERGIIQPIIVRQSEDQTGKHEIVAGERRWLAAQNAGLHEVPVVVIQADSLKSLEFAIVENVQRHDLNPIEEAKGYQRLIDEFNYDQEKVSKFIGKSRVHVTNSLRLLSLPKEVRSLIEEGKISQGHANGKASKSFVLYEWRPVSSPSKNGEDVERDRSKGKYILNALFTLIASSASLIPICTWSPCEIKRYPTIWRSFIMRL